MGDHPLWLVLWLQPTRLQANQAAHSADVPFFICLPEGVLLMPDMQLMSAVRVSALFRSPCTSVDLLFLSFSYFYEVFILAVAPI